MSIFCYFSQKVRRRLDFEPSAQGILQHDCHDPRPLRIVRNPIVSDAGQDDTDDSLFLNTSPRSSDLRTHTSPRTQAFISTISSCSPSTPYPCSHLFDLMYALTNHNVSCVPIDSEA